MCDRHSLRLSVVVVSGLCIGDSHPKLAHNESCSGCGDGAACTLSENEQVTLRNDYML